MTNDCSISASVNIEIIPYHKAEFLKNFYTHTKEGHWGEGGEGLSLSSKILKSMKLDCKFQVAERGGGGSGGGVQTKLLSLVEVRILSGTTYMYHKS